MTTERSTAPERYFFGPYEILDTLGRGGMGVVYRAHDRTLGREVALKILRDELRGEARVLARFRREAETFAKLDHPNIVHVHSVGAVENIPFIAMHYVEGETLANRLRRNGPMPWQDALRIGASVAEALHCAHAAQVIHRDIKPGNILLGDDGRVHVTDFGIAKVMNATTQLTQDGTRLGTPQYMCPERCRDLEVTPSSDLYSLGVVLFQSITGKLPYSARSSVELIERITGEQPARASTLTPGLPESVDRLLAWLLEKSPSRRPANAGVLAEAIERVLDGKPLDAGADDRAQALEQYRRGLPREYATPLPNQRTRALPGRKRLARKATHWWFGAPAWLRRGLGAAIAVLLVGATGFAVTSIALRPAPQIERLTDAQSLARWESTAPLIGLAQEGANARIGTLGMPGLRISNLAPGGIGSAFVLTLGDGATHSSLMLNAATGATTVLMPPNAAATSLSTLSVMPSAADGEDVAVLYASERDTRFVDLGSASIETGPTIPGERIFSGPASAASLPYWTGTAWAVVVAVTRGGHHDWHLYSYGGDLRGEAAVLTPGGSAIEAVSAAREGGALAFLRAGTTSELWFASQGGAPKLVDEGGLNLTQRAVESRSGRLTYAKEGEVVVVGENASKTRWPGDSPQWLGDSGLVAYLGHDALRRQQVFVMDPARPLEPRQLTHLETGVGAPFALTHDARTLAVPLPDGARFIVVDL